MIELRAITPDDIKEIKDWPPYRGGFEQMNYALRDNGWLDEFRDRSDTRVYAVVKNSRVIGFSLLIVTAEGDAEFRVAIHPDRTGKGIGRTATLATVERGFRQLDLDRVHLIVRKNNHRALKLYESVGFVQTGESVHTIQGKDIPFIDMDMTSDQFDDLKTGEDA